MNLGLSIFLSSIFLGIIVLFIATKDRWNWKKIIIRLLVGTICVGVLAVAGNFIYEKHSDYRIKHKIPDSPEVMNSFWDIPLDSTQEDIKFLKGKPSEILEDDDWVYKSDKNSSYDKYVYLIRFKDGKIRFIVCITDESFLSGIQGISSNSSSENIINKFGEPTNISVSEDGLSRIYSFDKYHVFFTLKKNKVADYGVYNPEIGYIRFDKEYSKNKKQSHTPKDE